MEATTVEVARSLSYHLEANSCRVDIAANDEANEQCRRDLRLTDPRKDKKRIEQSKDDLLEDSCAWILDDPAFLDWLSRENSRTLWISGDPGKGKTMIMIDLVSKLPRRLESDPGTLVSYFFCQNTVPELRNAVSILRGLIYLLVVEQESLIRHVRKQYDDAGSRSFEGPNALYALWEVLSDISNDQSLTGIYLMIDALDECDSGLDELLKLITNQNSDLSPRVKWLVTSRNQPTIQARLKPDGLRLNTSLELNSVHISRAVDTFIDFKVRELMDRGTYDSELEKDIRDYLSEKADGTFLWVALVCKELGNVGPGLTRHVLKVFPAGLEPLYERMVQQIGASVATFCKRILSLVALTYRPLYLRELEAAANLPKDLSSLQSAKELVGHCGSLLIVREEAIYFVHQSAKDYFIAGNGSGIFPSGQAEEHRKITHQSLKLMSENLKRDICGLQVPGALSHMVESEELDKHLRHIRYACCYWVDHLREANHLQQDRISIDDSEKVNDFLQKHFLNWLEALSLIGEVSMGVLMIANLQSMLTVGDPVVTP
jgi:hypothetical protein